MVAASCVCTGQVLGGFVTGVVITCIVIGAIATGFPRSRKNDGD